MNLIKRYCNTDHYNIANASKTLLLRDLLEGINKEVNSCSSEEREELLNQEVVLNMSSSSGEVTYGPCNGIVGWIEGGGFLLLGNVHRKS